MRVAKDWRRAALQAEARSADNPNNKGYEAMVAVTGVLSTMGALR